MPIHRLTCAVKFCDNYYLKTKEMLDGGYPITYHYFPRQVPLCRYWVEACGRTDYFKPEISFVCSIHFRPEDFKVKQSESSSSDTFRRSLNYNVIPSRNLTLEDIKNYTRCNIFKKSTVTTGQNKVVTLEISSDEDVNKRTPNLTPRKRRYNGLTKDLKVPVTMGVVSDESGEDPLLAKAAFADENTSATDAEYSTLKMKYDKMLQDFEEFKVNSKLEIERLKEAIKEKDDNFYINLRKILEGHLSDTEIDLVLFLRKQKRENILELKK